MLAAQLAACRGLPAIGVATYKPNVYLEISTWQGWSTEQEFAATLAFMRDRVGAERISWASDRTGVPLRVSPRDWVQAFVDSPRVAREHGFTFSREVVESILGGNAARLYRLPRI